MVLIFSALYKIKFGHFVEFGRWPLLINWSDVWLQRTRVKRWIGAQIVLKKPIKNKEVETLPAGSGGTGNPGPVVSGSWGGNGEPWTLGRVSARVCAVIEENKSWSAKWSIKDKLFIWSVNTRSQRERISVPEPGQSKCYATQTGNIICDQMISADVFSECHFSGKPHATTEVVFD